MLASLFNLRGLLISFGVALLLGTILGARGMYVWDHYQSDRAVIDQMKSTIAVLQGRADALDKAAKQDQARAAEADKTIKGLKETIGALRKKIPNGPCFTAADSERIRELWREFDAALDKYGAVRPARSGPP